MDLQRPTPAPLDPIPSPVAPASITVPPTPTAPKRARQSKTVWGLVAVAVGFLLTAIDAPADVAFLADGLQVEDIGPALAALGAILAALGLRLAKRPITR